jgi:hypothetical protein
MVLTHEHQAIGGDMKRIAIGVVIGLIGIAIPLTAMAGRKQQGTELNGMNLQGTSVNGSNMQGTQMQGRKMQGRKMQGVRLNGKTDQGRKVQGIIVGNGKATGAEGATGLQIEGVRVEGGRLVR